MISGITFQSEEDQKFMITTPVVAVPTEVVMVVRHMLNPGVLRQVTVGTLEDTQAALDQIIAAAKRAANASPEAVQ